MSHLGPVPFVATSFCPAFPSLSLDQIMEQTHENKFHQLSQTTNAMGLTKMTSEASLKMFVKTANQRSDGHGIVLMNHTWIEGVCALCADIAARNAIWLWMPRPSASLPASRLSRQTFMHAALACWTKTDAIRVEYKMLSKGCNHRIWKSDRNDHSVNEMFVLQR